MGNAPFLESFLSTARSYIGIVEVPKGSNKFPSSGPNSRGNELFRLCGYDKRFAWCAVFVSACAVKAGVSGIIVAKDSYARGVCVSTHSSYGAMWISGPAEGGSIAKDPQPGDLILFRTGSGQDSYHVGIVEYYTASDRTIHTIEGNTSDSCARREYDRGHSTIKAIVRPDWGKVGDQVTGFIANYNDSTENGGTGGYVSTGPLYTTTNDRHDMTMREIAYLDSNYKLTTSATDVKIGVINYTSMLGAFYEILAPYSYGSGTVDTSGLSGNMRTGFDYLLTKGFNAAACTAICANIEKETSWNPAAYNPWDVDGPSAGLCQWHNTRREAMIARVPDWQTNISGQLDYLVDELQTNYYRNLYETLKSVSNDVNGAKVGADKFVRKFEVPANVDQRSLERQAEAERIFGLLKFITPAGGGIRTQSGIVDPPVVKTIDIPTSIRQSGLIADYTNYGYWYSRWYKSSTQKRLADIWNGKGRTADRNIATIDGCYLIAMTTTFGTAGDIVTVELADGSTFNGILGDVKGADAGNIWGHVKPASGTSLVEWETYHPSYTTTATIPQNSVSGIQLGTWAGQKVVRVYNRGTYLR